MNVIEVTDRDGASHAFPGDGTFSTELGELVVRDQKGNLFGVFAEGAWASVVRHEGAK